MTPRYDSFRSDLMEPGELRATADRMLDILDRLRRVEEEKSTRDVNDADFVRLAQEAEHLGRLAFRWSQLQLQLAQVAGAGATTGRPTRLADVEPRPLDRILAAWREAQLRLEGARPGSPEAQQAVNDVERLREEYRTARESKR